MAKYLKIQSLILCVCLMLTAFSGISALAADPFSLLSYNADLDFITLDFNQAINTGTASIILLENGVPVETTIASANHANFDSSMATRYTYLVKKANGNLFDSDSSYKLTITSIDNAAGTETITSWVKAFAIEVIAEGTDLTNAQWSKQLNANGIPTVTNNAAGEIEATYSVASNYSLIGRAVGADTAANANAAEKNYTVKVTYADDAGTTHANWRLGISNSPGYRDNGGGFRGVWMWGQIQPNGKTSFNLQQRWDNNGTNKHTYDASINLSRTEGYELKLSVKDQFATAFLSGGKLADLALNQDYPGYVYLSPGPAGQFNSGFTSYTATISNFIATRCCEICGVEIDKTTDVEINDTLIATLEKGITPESVNAIKLSTEEGEVDADRYEVALNGDGTVATITLNGLEYRTVYKISFDGVEFLDEAENTLIMPVSFTTTVPPTELYSFGIAGGGDFEGTVTLEAVIANNTQAEPLSFIATIAIYNSQGQMVKINGDSATLEAGDTPCTISIANFVCDPEETYTAKCFVWDSFTGMNKIFEGIIE